MCNIQTANSTFFSYYYDIFTSNPERPVTDFGTIIEMFIVSRELHILSYIKYTHITLDNGAAIKASQVVWNNPQAWFDIILHLGDIHAMMTFFGIISTYIKGSGFEKNIF